MWTVPAVSGAIILISIALGAAMFALAVGIVLHAVRSGILTGPETYTVLQTPQVGSADLTDPRMGKPLPFVIKDDAKEAEIEEAALGRNTHRTPEYFDNLESLGR